MLLLWLIPYSAGGRGITGAGGGQICNAIPTKSSSILPNKFAVS